MTWNDSMLMRCRTAGVMTTRPNSWCGLQKAIRHLPEKQRLVFNLRYYDELEYAEISEILNTQVETLKTNFHYAKENIKKYIQKNYYERL